MGRATRRKDEVTKPKIQISSTPADLFRSLTATRKRRVLLVSLLAVAVFLVMDFGFFARELDYRVAEIGAGITGSPTVLVAGTTEADVPLQSNELSIPSVGIRAPVIYTETIDENHFQDLLSQGVVHYPNTAMPGQPGNVFIFGHSSDFLWRDNPYRHVFALLPHIAVGDAIELSDDQGNVYTYRVTTTFIVSPSDTRVLDQGDGSQSLLTLQTSYPFGTALSRYIVQAELVTP